MIDKKNRHIAFLLAASLFTNMAALPIQTLPISASTVAEETQELQENQEAQETSTQFLAEPQAAVDEVSSEEQTAVLMQQESETPTESVAQSTTMQQTPESTQQTGQGTETSTESTVLPSTEPVISTEITPSNESASSNEATPSTETMPSTDTTDATVSQQEAFQQVVQSYQSMPISSDRSMSLEWWYVMTGKVTASDLTVDENGSANLTFPESVVVGSSDELILLSYVRPDAYETKTITLLANAGARFDLTGTVMVNEESSNQASLSYQGLGSFEHPFSGMVVYGGQSEGIFFELKSSLFNALSSEAKFLDQSGNIKQVTLVSRVNTTFDGLFANHVLNKNGTAADWHVRLSDPETVDSAYYLPTLFGTLYSGVNIKLTLTDDSSEQPSERGYLCAVMQDNAVLEARNVTKEVTVPMVGELSGNATLTVENAEGVAEGSLSEEEFNELVEYYKTMPVVPGEMPLEWWFVVTDQLDELKAYLEQKAEQAKEGSVQKDIALFAEDGAETAAVEGETIELDNIRDADTLIQLSNVNARDYQDKTITVTASSSDYDLTKTIILNGVELAFKGFGSDSYPFKGTFQFSTASENTYFKLKHSLFKTLSTGAIVSNANLTCVAKSEDNVKGLFANTIKAEDNSENTFTAKINIKEASNVDETDKDDLRLPALVSTIESNAKVSLTATINAVEIPSIDANGFFCDTMKENAELTVNYPTIMPQFGTSKENIGGLVGTMESKASLKVNETDDIVIDVETKGKTAGGLVGAMKDGASLSITAKSLTVNRVSASTVNGSYVGSLVATAVNPSFTFSNDLTISAGMTSSDSEDHLTGYFVGGIVGKLECSTENYKLKVLPVSGLKLKGNDCGGLFGELDNSITLTIPTTTKSSEDSESSYMADVTVSCIAQNPSTQSAGALIGWYNPKAEHCKLTANNIKVKMSSDGFAYVGGMIGSSTGTEAVTEHHDIELTGSGVEISKSTGSTNLGGVVGSIRERTAYLNISGSVVAETHSSQTFGGLVAYADDKGHLIEVGKTDLSKSHIYIVTNSSGSAGGLVGTMDSGVLYITSQPDLYTAEMINNQPNFRGWILGNRGNVLVCTSDKNWSGSARSDDKNTNDTGVWGQVLHLDKFDDLVKLNDDHTLTIRKLPETITEETYADYYKITSLTDFAAVALRLQLNEKGLLKFENSDDIKESGGVKLKIENDIDIDLQDTGLTGLTRDIVTTYMVNGKSTTERHAITIIGEETKPSTITLPNTTVYTWKGNSASHDLQGLIADVDDLTLKNLKIIGKPQVKSLSNQAKCGIANEIYGDAKIENVTSSVKWTDTATSNSSTISGMLTWLATNKEKEISFKNCTWDGFIKTSWEGGDTQSTGGFVGYGKADKITFENCNIAGTIERNSNNIASAGGLIAVLSGANTLEINGLTVKNTINAESVKVTGGLLGYQWDCTATISDVTIQGATLNTPKARFGGLVYAGRGYWKVEKNGITFSKTDEGVANTFNGKSSADSTSGLLLADGFWDQSGLYLEVLNEGYKINEGSVSFNNSTNFEYFDELVGKTINKTADGNYSGIVSIATSDSTNEEDRKIDQDECDTYKDQTTTNTYKNKNTRYYYNLDLFRDNINQENLKEGATIDSSAKMVLWSAYNSCAQNLQSYFQAWGTKTITGTLNLEGYSFYPVPFDGASISNATITFGFNQLETMEEKNRKPSDSNYQHAEMHTGIFTSAVNDSSTNSNLIVSVNGLTLSGTVGGFNGNYGAIVRGNVQGKDAEHITTLAISNVTLKGIRIYNADSKNNSGSYIVAPLLIHSIGSYTTMNLKGVVTEADQYQSGSGTSTQTVKAASSLIGDVGGDTAAEIKLNFSDMQLEENGNKNGKCTIFTHALFLESFQYQSGTCQGTYNFTASERYTLGYELQNTTSGRNPKEQYWFFGEDGQKIYEKLEMTGPESDAFSQFLRYVCAKEGDDNGKYHEIDINLPAVNLLEGCGTYSHPYAINSARQLKALNNAITDTLNSDWQITVTEAVLKGSFANQDGHTEASDTDIVYKYDSAQKKWIKANDEGTSVESGAIQKYLRNAYYVITTDLTLTNWSGLGGSDTNKRFSGVIKGADSNTTITISDGNETQFGGLIKYSSGSVVKDLTIQYTGTVTVGLVNSATPSGTNNASFFGGVVGWCIGGDTIIDNVTVKYDEAAINTNLDFTAAGGCVGLVGGASDQGGGGVVFRGTVSSNLQKGRETQYYRNSYVGRVLDGYAVSETQGIDNGENNYPIPYLTNNKNENTVNTPELTITDNTSTVEVGNAAGLWLFSAMENSRHGNAYSSGKSRSGDYSYIGETVDSTTLIDEKSENYTEIDFYLWKHFGITCGIPTTALTLNITADCDMTSFGNAFRGIGVSQGKLKMTSTDQSGYDVGTAFLNINKLNGKGKTIKLKQSRIEPVGESENWASMGTGLFPILVCQSSKDSSAGTTIEKLKLTGSTKLSTGNTVKTTDTLFGFQSTLVGAGMLAGGVLNNISNASIKIDNVNISGSIDANVSFVGGLVGYCGAIKSKWSALKSIEIADCTVHDSVINGQTNIGGFIGFTNATELTIDGANGNSFKVNGQQNSVIEIKYTSNVGNNFANGIGGLCGAIYSVKSLNIKNSTIDQLTIENRGEYNSDVGFGGLAGSVSTQKDSTGLVQSIQLNTITITDEEAHVSLGGLIGYLSDTKFNGWTQNDKDGGTNKFEIKDIQMGYADKSSVTLKGFQVGGLIGMLKAGAVTLEIGDEVVDTDGSTSDGSIYIGNSSSGNERNVTIKANSYTNYYNKTSLCSLIGTTCNSPIINARNLHFAGVDVQEGDYTSLVLASNPKAKPTLTITNMEAVNCSVAVKNEKSSGLLYGRSSDVALNINGYNIMLKRCTIGDKAEALLGGYSHTSLIKLVAVSIIDCTEIAKDFQEASSESYVIRANYTGDQSNTTGSSKPYVPTNPVAAGSLKNIFITGDGAAFADSNQTTIGMKIANESTYYNVSEAKAFYKNNVSDQSQPRISTYSVAGGNSNTEQDTSSDSSGNTDQSESGSSTTKLEDFPVLVIPAVRKSEVNNAVYQYISLLTNFVSTETTLKGKLQGSITATTYEWKDGAFQKAGETTKCSLKIDNDGIISVNTGCYDNTKNQFTLLDVPFKDPTSDKGVYHLYIPVVVQKLMNYRFSASASVGTSYYTSHYADLSTQVLASHEEQITTLLTFEYERSKADWQTAIDNGESLLWNFDKVIELNYQSNDKFPEGTKLTLIDKNNQNAAYFAEYDGKASTLKFDTRFQGYKANRMLLCDGLSLKVSNYEESTSGNQYVKLNSSDGATLRIGDAYYRPATSNDTGSKFTITVEGDDNDKFLLKEQFYLTIQTPQKSKAFVNVLIQGGDNLKNTNSSEMIPNKLIMQENGNSYHTKNGNENRIIIGDFFKESVNLTSRSGELMSEDSNSIELQVQSTISFVDKDWFEYYNLYAKGTNLYQRFDLQLKQWQSESSGTATNFAEGTVMKVEYFKDNQSVSGGGIETLPETALVELKFPEAITFDSTSITESLSVTLSAKVTLTYSAGGILSQFIERSDTSKSEGLQFLVSSHLAYSEDALKRSSVSSSDTTNGKRFYREKQTVATLLYNSDGVSEHDRVDQLGINGRLANVAMISSYATYDVSKLNTASSATTLKYSFKLLKKNNEGIYEEVSSASDLYNIGIVQVKWLNQSSEVKTVDNSSNVFSGNIDLKENGGLDPSVSIEFSIPLTINSGDTLEDKQQFYSNYEVELTVSLTNGDNAIIGSTASDYIIYTNAKIVTDLIE